ncbi:MAG: hypothetical protein II689_01510 [Firmicutes bacterium]|nr:hypothetical protein [Bacillota bacterium]
MNATIKDKTKVITLLLVITVIFMFIIGINAYISQVQYEINSLDKQIQEAERKIQSLEVAINSATNITNLEERAEALGLVYPTFDQIVYLIGDDAPVRDLAVALKEKVY